MPVTDRDRKMSYKILKGGQGRPHWSEKSPEKN